MGPDHSNSTSEMHRSEPLPAQMDSGDTGDSHINLSKETMTNDANAESSRIIQAEREAHNVTPRD